jgi:glyoxylase-like metal-dependent hydrolase (beta-lactamase superfamily II)
MNERYILKRIKVGPLEVNCYLIADAESHATVIIDPGGDPAGIVKIIDENGFTPVGIVNTHGHFDHIGANAALKQKYVIPLCIHVAEADYLTAPTLNGSQFFGDPFASPAADVLLNEGDRVAAGSLELTVMHTPGHTPGCICLLVDDLAFTGDTLFCGSVGRSDLTGGSEETLLQSLEKFRRLSPETRILPGHGPECLLKNEFRHNPYLKQFKD